MQKMRDLFHLFGSMTRKRCIALPILGIIIAYLVSVSAGESSSSFVHVNAAPDPKVWLESSASKGDEPNGDHTLPASPLFQVVGLQSSSYHANENIWEKVRWNGSITSALSSIILQNGTIIVFGRGSDTALWYQTSNGSSWKNWESLGGSMLSSAPSSVALNDDNVMVFVRGPEYSRAVWFTSWNGTDWQSMQQIGGELTSAPSVVALNNDTTIIFGRGSDMGLWYLTGNGSTWGPWKRISNTLITSSPSAVALNDDNILIFARGEDQSLKYSIMDRDGLKWYDLGGRLTSAPSTVVLDNGTIVVFVRGADSSLWHLSKEGESDEFGPWHRDGGRISSAPSALKLTNGTVTVFSRGLDSGFWITTFK